MPNHCFIKGFVVDGEFDASVEVCGVAISAKAIWRIMISGVGIILSDFILGRNKKTP